ncbi:MAG: CoA-binding protein [Firmicutes bacterium]|nr:CoA-binding protein [Bacillota bacterium]MCL5038656.1 CoA-binding protein [Bacillota bacterium]
MVKINYRLPKDDTLKKILSESKTIAVVGLSKDPLRPSHEVASYLQEHGYKIIPVNPTLDEVLGEKSYPSLDDVPGEVDIVDIFRRSQDVPPVVESAIRKKAKVVWMQEGIVNHPAAERAMENGLAVVMDRCTKKEHMRLVGQER